MVGAGALESGIEAIKKGSTEWMAFLAFGESSYMCRIACTREDERIMVPLLGHPCRLSVPEDHERVSEALASSIPPSCVITRTYM